MKRPAASSQGKGPIKKAKRTVKRMKKRGSPEMYQKGQVFPDVLTTKLRYNSNMVAIDAAAAASTYYSFVLNGMFDFDFDNILGNKQPLYFDELVTLDGPYKSYRVGKWTTKIHVINDSVDPLLVYWSQSTTVSDQDTLIEVQNRPNVRELILTQRDGAKNEGTLVCPGSIYETWGKNRANPESLSGTSAANPSAATYGTLYFYNPGGVSTTPVNCWVKITHDFEAVLNTADAVIS